MIKTIIPYTNIEGFSLGVLGNSDYSGIDDFITSFASAIEGNKGTRFFKKINFKGFNIQSKKNEPVYAMRKDELITIIKDKMISSVVFLKPDDYFTGKITTSIDLLIKDYETINEVNLSNDELATIKKLTQKKSKIEIVNYLIKKRLGNYLTKNGFPDDFKQDISEILDMYNELNFEKRIPAKKITNLLSNDLQKAIVINQFFNKLATKTGIDYDFFKLIINEINKIDDFNLIDNYLDQFNSIIK